MPFVRHSPSASAGGERSECLPPGMTILPALRVLPARGAARGLGSPSALRWRRVSGRCGSGGGGGGGEGDESAEERADERADENGEEDCEDASESDGVLSSTSMASLALRRFERRVVRGGAASWDSSNVRLGLRPLCASADVSGGVGGARLEGAEVLALACESGGEREEEEGEAEREGGRGMPAGSGGGGAAAWAFLRGMAGALLRGAALPLPLDGRIGSGTADSSRARPRRSGFSTTSGGPVCGPARFRTEEKCSQS